MRKIHLLSFLVFLFIQCEVEKETFQPETPGKVSVLSQEYTKQSDKFHYVLLILEKGGDCRKRKADLMVFNEENGFQKIRMNNIYLSIENKENIPIVSIRRFQDLHKAKDYIEILNEKGFLKTSEKILPFSQDNYRRFLKKKDLEEYEAFYHSVE